MKRGKGISLTRLGISIPSRFQFCEQSWPGHILGSHGSLRSPPSPARCTQAGTFISTGEEVSAIALVVRAGVLSAKLYSKRFTSKDAISSLGTQPQFTINGFTE